MNDQQAPVAVLLPTYDNRLYLEPCLASFRATTAPGAAHIYLLNNGPAGDTDWAAGEDCTIIDNRHNLGWERSIERGVQESTAPILLFCNDDVLFTLPDWLERLCGHLDDPQVAAVGPSSNYVSGAQSVWTKGIPSVFAAPYLVGFCMLVRRSAYEAVGGIDTRLPGGDDLDLSLRLRRNGYVLVGDREVFVYHKGSVTGVKVHGGPHISGGWNSALMSHLTLAALTEKLGATDVQSLWEPVTERPNPPPRARS